MAFKHVDLLLKTPLRRFFPYFIIKRRDRDYFLMKQSVRFYKIIVNQSVKMVLSTI